MQPKRKDDGLLEKQLRETTGADTVRDTQETDGEPPEKQLRGDVQPGNNEPAGKGPYGWSLIAILIGTSIKIILHDGFWGSFFVFTFCLLAIVLLLLNRR